MGLKKISLCFFVLLCWIYLGWISSKPTLASSNQCIEITDEQGNKLPTQDGKIIIPYGQSIRIGTQPLSLPSQVNQTHCQVQSEQLVIEPVSKRTVWERVKLLTEGSYQILFQGGRKKTPGIFQADTTTTQPADCKVVAQAPNTPDSQEIDLGNTYAEIDGSTQKIPLGALLQLYAQGENIEGLGEVRVFEVAEKDGNPETVEYRAIATYPNIRAFTGYQNDLGVLKINTSSARQQLAPLYSQKGIPSKTTTVSSVPVQANQPGRIVPLPNIDQTKYPDLYQGAENGLNYIAQLSGLLPETDEVVVWLNEVANQLKSPSTPLIRVLVVKDDPDINAAVFPDGTIVINQALINSLDYKEEILAILAHEVVHFDKQHHVKNHNAWFDEEIRKQSITSRRNNDRNGNVFGATGLNRLHEYEADLTLLGKLNQLEINPFVFEQAIKKIGGTIKSQATADAVHGTLLDRRLNTLLVSGFVDFDQSSKDQQLTDIPGQWKQAVGPTKLTRLMEEKHSKDWQQLLEQAGPELLEAFISHLYIESRESREGLGWSYGFLDAFQNIPKWLSYRLDRKQLVPKFNSVIKLLEDRINTSSSIATENKNQAFLLALTVSTGIRWEDWMNLKFKTFFWKRNVKKTISTIRSKITVDVLRSDAVHVFSQLNQARTPYISAGLPGSENNRFRILINDIDQIPIKDKTWRKKILNQEYPNNNNSELTNLIDHYAIVARQEAKAFNGVAEKRFQQLTDELYRQHLQEQHWWISPYKLTNKSIEFYQTILQNTSLKTQTTYHNIESAAVLIGDNAYGGLINFFDIKPMKNKIKDQALKQLISQFTPDNPELYTAIQSHDSNKFADLILKDPEEFLYKLAQMKTKHPELFSNSSIEWVIQQIELLQPQLFDKLELPKKAETSALKRFQRFPPALNEALNITNSQLKEYAYLRYLLHITFLSTAGRNPTEVRLPHLEKILSSTLSLELFKDLPLAYQHNLITLLNQEVRNITSFNQITNRIIASNPVEVQYGTSSYQPTSSTQGSEDLIIQRMVRLPIVTIARNRLLTYIENEPRDSEKIASAYDLQMSLLIQMYMGSKIADKLNETAFTGGDEISARLIEPFSKRLISQMQLLSPELILKDPKKAITLFRVFKAHIRFTSENNELTSAMQQMIIQNLPFNEALTFLKEEALSGNISLENINEFIENRVSTREEFNKVRGEITVVLDHWLSNQHTKLGIGAYLDQLTSMLMKKDLALDLLDAAIHTNQSDTALRTSLATPWWKTTLEVPSDTPNYRGYWPEVVNGNIEVKGPLSNLFTSFKEVLDVLYILSPEQKTLLLRKILLSSDGALLLNKDAHAQVVALLLSQMEQDKTLTPLMKAVLTSTLKAGDPVRVFLPIANNLNKIILRKPVSNGSNVEGAKSIQKKGLKGSFTESYFGNSQITDFTVDRLTTFMAMDKAQNLRKALEQDEVIADLYTTLDQMLVTKQKEFNTLKTVATQVQNNEKFTMLDLLMNMIQMSGPLGIRTGQVAQQFLDIPEEYQEKFRELFDSNPGQSKYTAFATLEQAAKTDPDIAKFLDEDLVSIDKKIGGGSLVTVYLATVKIRNGADNVTGTRQEVLKILNPNAEFRVRETSKLVRDILADLKQTDKSRLSEYEKVERLIDIIEQWILADINDETFLVLDPINADQYTNYETSNGTKVKIAAALKPNSKVLKREPFIAGETLNKTISRMKDPKLTSEQRNTSIEQVKQYTEAMAEDYARHLAEPAYINASERERYLLHSDVHPGNIMIGEDKALYWIDRNFYLNLFSEDVVFVRQLLLTTDRRQRLQLMIRYFANLPENQGKVNSDQLIKEIERTFLGNELLRRLGRQGDDDLGSITKVMRELTQRGIVIPLRMMIMFKNLNAVDDMLNEAGLKPFSFYITEAEKNFSPRPINKQAPVVENITPKVEAVAKPPTAEFEEEPLLIEKNIVIPDGLEIIEGENVGAQAKVYIDRKNKKLYRTIDKEKIGLTTTMEFARQDFNYKIEVARKDKTGLTPKVYAYDPKTLTIEMEYIEGVSFTKVNKLEKQTVQTFWKKLADFHAQGIYHGDLFTLSNWILTPDNEVRLIDPQFTLGVGDYLTVEKVQAMDQANVQKRLHEIGITKADLEGRPSSQNSNDSSICVASSSEPNTIAVVEPSIKDQGLLTNLKIIHQEIIDLWQETFTTSQNPESYPITTDVNTCGTVLIQADILTQPLLQSQIQQNLQQGKRVEIQIKDKESFILEPSNNGDIRLIKDINSVCQ